MKKRSLTEVLAFLETMKALAAEVERLDDRALASALLNEVWAEFDFDSRQSALVAEAVERLRRTAS